MPAAQDVVDASEHYHGEQTQGVIPSLLTVVIDTNPRAWSAMNSVLTLTQAISNILIYINAHIACDNANEVAIVAAHPTKAVWLYPTPPRPSPNNAADPTPASKGNAVAYSANKYPKFAQVEASVLANVRTLIDETTEDDIQSRTTTKIADALTLALHYINKTSISITAGRGSAAGAGGAGGSIGAAAAATSSADGLPGLNARILVVSVSDSNPTEYIRTMNAVFAAAHWQIPIDTLSLWGNPTFLQQGSYITGGAFIRAKEPQGILQLLMFGFVRCPPSHEFGGESDAGGDLLAVKGADKKKGGGGPGSGRGGNPLVIPSSALVDFRAACFCHRRVVDTGFVCSVCLSIFCEIPKEGKCPTCQVDLQIGNYGPRLVAG